MATKVHIKKMVKNKKILILSLVFLALTIFATYPNSGSAQIIGRDPALVGGLVPCGKGSDDPCTLCHFIVGFQNLVNYGLWFVLVVAFVAIFFAGVMYVVSTGDESMMNSAKSFLKASLIGFLVVAGAWLIVNTTLQVISQSDTGHTIIQGVTSVNWFTFTCSTASNALTTPPQPSASPVTAPAPASGGWADPDLVYPAP